MPGGLIGPITQIQRTLQTASQQKHKKWILDYLEPKKRVRPLFFVTFLSNALKAKHQQQVAAILSTGGRHRLMQNSRDGIQTHAADGGRQAPFTRSWDNQSTSTRRSRVVLESANLSVSKKINIFKNLGWGELIVNQRDVCVCVWVCVQECVCLCVCLVFLIYSTHQRCLRVSHRWSQMLDWSIHQLIEFWTHRILSWLNSNSYKRQTQKLAQHS